MMKYTAANRLKLAPNYWLLAVFAALWMFDCFYTVWAVNNGFIEAWNQWTRLLLSGHFSIFIIVKVLTLSMVIWIVRWANTTVPYAIFVALAVFNMLLLAVSAANIITVLGA